MATQGKSHPAPVSDTVTRISGLSDAHIFHLETAAARSAPPEKRKGDVKGGKNDCKEWVVSSTRYTTVFGGSIPSQGSIELGVRKKMLRAMVNQAKIKKNGRIARGVGEFKVNHVLCIGQLIIDFNKKTAEINYFHVA